MIIDKYIDYELERLSIDLPDYLFRKHKHLKVYKLKNINKAEYFFYKYNIYYKAYIKSHFFIYDFDNYYCYNYFFIATKTNVMLNCIRINHLFGFEQEFGISINDFNNILCKIMYFEIYNNYHIFLQFVKLSKNKLLQNIFLNNDLILYIAEFI
jgi:hypothetical protein